MSRLRLRWVWVGSSCSLVPGIAVAIRVRHAQNIGGQTMWHQTCLLRNGNRASPDLSLCPSLNLVNLIGKSMPSTLSIRATRRIQLFWRHRYWQDDARRRLKEYNVATFTLQTLERTAQDHERTAATVSQNCMEGCRGETPTHEITEKGSAGRRRTCPNRSGKDGTINVRLWERSTWASCEPTMGSF